MDASKTGKVFGVSCHMKTMKTGVDFLTFLFMHRILIRTHTAKLQEACPC